MSTPGHHNDVVLVGDVRDVYTEGDSTILGVILLVDAGEPCEVPVMLPAPQAGLAVGDRLWVRGRLAFEPMAHGRQSLYFVRARWVEVMRRAGGAQ
jgi:hypothetical protein